MEKEAFLDVRHLHIEFHDHEVPETVVEDFSLRLYEEEIVGIVGESGSGKSMSALAIAGLLKRHALTCSGEILFDGTDLLTCDREKLRSFQGDEISMIFQEPMTSLNPLRRIGWQIEESLRIHHKQMRAKERKEMALRTMEAVGLPKEVYHMYPHELSGGMRQRVMIAAATIARPKLLIADEPTTALDTTMQAQIIALLQKVNKKRKTAILFISHDLSLVQQLCHRVIVMQKGRIVETGETKAVFTQPKQPYTKALIEAIPKGVL